jgi:uncharacterized protein (UPF0335 family)
MSEQESAPDIGHNAGPSAADQLRAIISRVERLHEERHALGADIAEVFKEAKSGGFDVTVLKKLIAERRQDPDKWQQQQDILEVYRAALAG